MNTPANRYPALQNRLIAAGSLTAILALTGCDSSYDEARAATESYAAENDVSDTCLGNLRARISPPITTGEVYDKTTLKDIAYTTCPSENQDKANTVASLLNEENQESDYKDPIYAIAAGACAVLAAGGYWGYRRTFKLP